MIKKSGDSTNYFMSGSQWSSWDFPFYLNRISELTASALWKARMNFDQNIYSYAPTLAMMLEEISYQLMEKTTFSLDYTGDAFLPFRKNMCLAIHNVGSFLTKMAVISDEDYAEFYQRALEELEHLEAHQFIVSIEIV